MRKAETQHNHAQNQPAPRKGGSAGLESLQGEQIAQFAEMIEASPQMGRLGGFAAKADADSAVQCRLADMIHNSPNAAAQRKVADAIHNSPHVMTQRQRLDGLTGEISQREEGEEPLQEKVAPREEAPAKPNNTGLPGNLRNGIESLSGVSMDNVKVNYNSSQPAQLNAHAYAQGTDIHVASGQEQHLPHEAWHVVQQAQGRVQPTVQMSDGIPVNDDAGLEREADVMGERAISNGVRQGKSMEPAPIDSIDLQPVQRVVKVKKGNDSAESAAPADLVTIWRATGHLKKIMQVQFDEKVDLNTYVSVIRNVIQDNNGVLSFNNKDGWTPLTDIGDLAAKVMAGLMSSPELDGNDLFYDAIESPVGNSGDSLLRVKALLSEASLLPKDRVVRLEKLQNVFATAQPSTELTLDEGEILRCEGLLEGVRKGCVKRVDALQKDVALDVELGKWFEQKYILGYWAGYQYPNNWTGLSESLQYLDKTEKAVTAYLQARSQAQPEQRIFIHKKASVLDRHTEMVLGNWNGGRESPNDKSLHIHVDGPHQNVLYYLIDKDNKIYICDFVPWHMDSKMGGKEIGKTSEISMRIGNLTDFEEYLRPEKGKFEKLDAWSQRNLEKFFG